MLVYRWKEHDMTVTFTDGIDLRPEVELSVGREVRTLPLREFTEFLLTIVEEGRKATIAYLESPEKSPQDETQTKARRTVSCEA